METVELHIIPGSTKEYLGRMAIVEFGGRGLLIDLYPTIIHNFKEDGCKVVIDDYAIDFTEKIEATMESGRWTAYVIQSVDAGLLLEQLDRSHWAIQDGDTYICQSWKQGKPMVDRTIYSA